MTPIVTVAEARRYLRVDESDDDAQNAMMIAAATEAALVVADTWDQASPPPARLQLAVLAHVAQAYDDRTNVGAPADNTRLLGPLRTLDV